jgi:hypothetical protein
MAEFSTWSRDNLERFAAECYQRMVELQNEVDRLKQEKQGASNAD